MVRSNDRNHKEEQAVLSGGRRERYECRVEAGDDMPRERGEEIARECCEDEVDGRFDNFDRTVN